VKLIQGLVLLLGTALISGYAPAHSTEPHKIEVVAKRFAFEPAEITVHKGEPVTIELKSEDVSHGLSVKELGIKTEVKKDSTSEVTFTPQKEGTYTGTCAHFCGRGHGSMKLTIHVTG